jgi:hypothetical protein
MVAGSLSDPVDHLFPVPEPIHHPLDLVRHKLNIRLTGVGRAGIVSQKSPHPPKRALLYSEEFSMDFHPEKRLLERDRRFHQTRVWSEAKTRAVTLPG